LAQQLDRADAATARDQSKPLADAPTNSPLQDQLRQDYVVSLKGPQRELMQENPSGLGWQEEAIGRRPPARPSSSAPQPNSTSDGAFYARLSNGYKVSPPPIGSTVTALPNGAITENIKGTTYFLYGGAYYRQFYSGSSVIYEVVAKPA
jgi:hypothetical protein